MALITETDFLNKKFNVIGKNGSMTFTNENYQAAQPFSLLVGVATAFDGKINRELCFGQLVTSDGVSVLNLYSPTNKNTPDYVITKSNGGRLLLDHGYLLEFLNSVPQPTHEECCIM